MGRPKLVASFQAGPSVCAGESSGTRPYIMIGTPSWYNPRRRLELLHRTELNSWDLVCYHHPCPYCSRPVLPGQWTMGPVGAFTSSHL